MINQLVACLARTAIPAARRHTLYARYLRPFSTTPRVRAIKDIPAFTAALQKTTVFKKLASHPEAINAVGALLEMIQEAGTDMAPGGRPSTFKMAKFMMSSKFRKQMKVVSEEMEKANVDLKSKEVIKEIKVIQKALNKALTNPAEPPK